MNIKEFQIVTKAVIESAAIHSSSDFVMMTYEIYSKFFPGLAEKIEPIIMIESGNYHADWVSNSVYSEGYLASAPDEDMYHAMTAYRIVLDYFLNDDIISKKFIMDETDLIGWQIYKELDTKYNFCRKRLVNVQNAKGYHAKA